MTATTVSGPTASPGATRISEIVPASGATISISIFIASITTIVSSSCTLSPTLAAMLRILPTIGALTGVATAWLPEARAADESPRGRYDTGSEDELDNVAPHERQQPRLPDGCLHSMAREPELQPQETGDVENYVANEEEQRRAPDLAIH